MQSVSSRIWTRIAVFISYGDNDYTTGTSTSWVFTSLSLEHFQFKEKKMQNRRILFNIFHGVLIFLLSQIIFVVGEVTVSVDMIVANITTEET